MGFGKYIRIIRKIFLLLLKIRVYTYAYVYV